MKLLNYTALAALLTVGFCAPALSAPTWTEGVNYFLVDPPHATSLPPGKVEVTEVFSYACPACNLWASRATDLCKAGTELSRLWFLAVQPPEDAMTFQNDW